MNMKKRGFLLIFVFFLFLFLNISFSFAAVPDADKDGVPDAEDKCANSDSNAVDQFGCTCQQKTKASCKTDFPRANCCTSDSNPCTDDCGVNNLGRVACNSINNNHCTGGYCSGGRCIVQQSKEEKSQGIEECKNECYSGQIKCSGVNYQTCGNYDSDLCLEWGNGCNLTSPHYSQTICEGTTNYCIKIDKKGFLYYAGVPSCSKSIECQIGEYPFSYSFENAKCTYFAGLWQWKFKSEIASYEFAQNNNCNDGFDNDCDGDVDQADSGCNVGPQKCGNGVVEPGESCDRNNFGPLRDLQCEEYAWESFTGGTLKCTNCKIDTSSCIGKEGTCGDNIINVGETCDNYERGIIVTCIQFNEFISGGVKCKNCQLDTEGCFEKSKCGNLICDKGESIEVCPADCSRGSLGPQSTLVIVASMFGRPPPIDVETANKLVFDNGYGSVNDFYVKNSFGQVSLVGKVVGPYTITITEKEICEGMEADDDLWDRMLKAALDAANSDVNFNDYTRIVLAIPRPYCTGFNGRSVIGKIKVPTPDGDVEASVNWDFVFSLGIIAHELGHGFGMMHANSMECLSCRSNEYGDEFDVMGKSRLGYIRHINAPHKEEVGWLTDNTIVTTEGEYLLKPLEAKEPKGAIQQIKLPIKVKPQFYSDAENVYYTLEFRQPIDYDAGAESRVYSGILIHLSGFPSSILFRTNVVNYEQNTQIPLLQIGQSFKDNVNGYEITLEKIDADGALVKIDKLTATNPQLHIDKTSFTFTSQQDTITPTQTLAITNNGGGNLIWQVSDDAAWLTVRRNLQGQETSGTETAGQSSTPPLEVSVNTAGMSAGTYSATISVTSNGGNANIPVTLTISSGGCTGELRGQIVKDDNGDGIYQANEKFIRDPSGTACSNEFVQAGISVNYQGPAAGLTLANRCNPNPYYTVSLPSGTYSLSMTVPSGWNKTGQTANSVTINCGQAVDVWYAVRPPQQGGTCGLQGFKVNANLQAFDPPATIYIDGTGYLANPYQVSVSAGNYHTVSSSSPSGYEIRYNVCNACTSHPDSSFITGTSTSASCNSGSFTDVYWMYCKGSGSSASGSGNDLCCPSLTRCSDGVCRSSCLTTTTCVPSGSNAAGTCCSGLTRCSDGYCRSGCPSTCTGELLGRILDDKNGNGLVDVGEPFIRDPSGPPCSNEFIQSGIKVQYAGIQSGSVVANRCNPEPTYSVNLPQGTYDLSMSVPTGWRLVAQTDKQFSINCNQQTHAWFAVQQIGTQTNNPQLRINPTSFSFTATQGGNNPASQTLTIFNDGQQNLIWSVSTNQPWLTVSRNFPTPTSGVESPNGKSTPPLDVNINIAGLGVGAYEAKIIINSNAGSIEIPVVLGVSSTGATYTSSQCTDSDNGRNPDIKGTASGKDGNSITDVCYSEQFVIESYCISDGSAGTALMFCEAGKKCQNGECVI